MKTLDEVLNNFKSNCVDGRDAHRLSEFVEEKDLHKLGLSMKEEYVGTHTAIEFNRENILERLQRDVNFGVEKAVNQRGISTSLMTDVVKMWNDILEDGLENCNLEGLSLFRETANLDGWEIEI